MNRQTAFRVSILQLAAAVFFLGSSGQSASAALATYQFGRGPITFGLALPEGASSAGVRVGALPTQTDVKTRWPDGSTRFAVVSVEIPSAGNYDIQPGSNPVESFVPTWPNITLELVINGATWVATPGAFNTANMWLSGPVVKESRVVARPTLGAPHPQLEVVFDIRSYAGGSHRIDVTVQNVRDAVTMDKAPASSVTLKVNGAPIWSHGAVTTYSMTRWRHVEWSGAQEATITPDFEPAYLSAAVPRILPTVTNTVYDVKGANYDLMGGPPAGGYPAFLFGAMTTDMAAGGGRKEIGALNWWEAEYLVHKTPNLRTAVLRNADLTGAWSNHLTKPDGTIIKLGDPGYPSQWWWDTRSYVGFRPLATQVQSTSWQGAREGLTGDTDTGAVGVLARYNEEHVPAPMYVAYLISGDRFYVDQAKFFSTRAILSVTPGWYEPDPVNFPGWRRGRDGDTGNERILDFSGMSREFAWPLRLLGFTAWMVPDADPDKEYFVSTVQNNLDHAGGYLDTWVRLGYGGALGAMAFEENASASTARNGQVTGRFGSTWRMAYTAYSVDWCTRQKLWNIRPSVDAFVRRIVNLHVLLNIGNPKFLDGEAGLSFNYYPVFNTMSGGRFTKWFNTYAELKDHNENYPYSDGAQLGWPGGWNKSMPATGYYDVEHWIALQMALRRGVPNAQTAITRLKQVTGVEGDINARAGFAITFEGAVADPGGGGPKAPAAPSKVRVLP